MALFTIDTVALKMVRLIEEAIIVVSSAITFTNTNTIEPWKLKTIYQFIVDVCTGDIWVIIICWPRSPKHLLYLARVLHFGYVGYTNCNISIPLGIRYRRRVVIIIASRSVQIQWRIHCFSQLIKTTLRDSCCKLISDFVFFHRWVEYGSIELYRYKEKFGVENDK